MLTALIDADVIAYQAGFICEIPVKWDDDIYTYHASESAGRQAFTEAIDSIKEKVGADAVVLTFSNYTKPWRKSILETYKMNRVGTRKPLLFTPLKAWASDNWTTYERSGLEGDDLLGVLATHPELIDGDKIICSIDKDMKTIPGRFYDFGKDVFHDISEDQASVWHMTQTLTGDTTDGYTGCPRCGPVAAAKILAEADAEAGPGATLVDREGSRWKHVVKAYVKAGLSEEVALVQARVARICRTQEYDIHTDTLTLWTPPEPYDI